MNITRRNFLSKAGVFGLTALCPNMLFNNNTIFQANHIGSEDHRYRIRRDGKIGFINKSGDEVIECIYDGAYIFACGRTVVEKDNKDGVIDATGELIVPIEYDLIDSYSEGLASCLIGEKKGYINIDGEMVISPQYDDAGEFTEGVACVYSIAEERPLVINHEGDTVLKPPDNISYMMPYSDGLARFTTHSGSYGYIDILGNILIPPIDNMRVCKKFINGTAIVRGNHEYLLIDNTGSIISTLPHGYIDNFSGGLARVYDGSKFGYIDHYGNVVIDLIYDTADGFSEGYAYINHGSKYGYIDKCGNIRIIPEYPFHFAGGFINGLSDGQLRNEELVYINRRGDLVWKESDHS